MWILRRLFTAAALALPAAVIYLGLSALFGVHADGDSAVPAERVANALFGAAALGGTWLFWKGACSSSKRVNDFVNRWVG